MGADSIESAVRAATWTGQDLEPFQRQQLSVFHGWLGSEAVVAGGIGPHEENRLWSRHIADSLLFGLGVEEDTGECLDVGSGVGLPGIPLAILHPSVSFTLLDRSGRRCDLMRRAIAVLGLKNCEVSYLDVTEAQQTFPWIVSRAAIPPDKILIHVKQLLEPGGTAILGLSRSDQHKMPLLDQPGLTAAVVDVPLDILDTDVKLLKIEAT